METMTLDRSSFLRRALWADAATCLPMGALLALAAGPLAKLLALPEPLLFWAGIALFPCAAFMAWLACQGRVSVPGAWLVILGNAAWIAGSVLVLALLAPNAFGTVFVIGQAIVVAVLAALEHTGLRRIG